MVGYKADIWHIPAKKEINIQRVEERADYGTIIHTEHNTCIRN
jgi:hypothetical protein